MTSALMPETVQKLFTAETLRSAAKQSERLRVVPLRLRRAIRKYLREQEKPNMRRKVLSLSESFNNIKGVQLMLTESTSRNIVDDPLKTMEGSKRWKIKTSYGDVGFKYRDDQTVAYIAARMPAVYSACHRVLREVRRRLPGFAPTKVLDFGSGTGSVMWAMRDVWPHSLERINLIEPSKSMQRAAQSLLLGLKDLPLIQSYDTIQELTQKLGKSEREHDLVMATRSSEAYCRVSNLHWNSLLPGNTLFVHYKQCKSQELGKDSLMVPCPFSLNVFRWFIDLSYVLGEVPSLKDRITIVRQLWDLTRDVLVLVEPGTPQGFSIISQMRSHILWMEKRKCRKSRVSSDEASKDLVTMRSGAFVVAPCPHDGACPLENTGKYCHFVQRLQRTSSQRSYKKSKGEPLRGFEDEKFCYVALRRGSRPRGPWPLDGMKFDTLKEQHAKRNPEDMEIDYEDLVGPEDEEDISFEEDLVSYNSDATETEGMYEDEEDMEEAEEMPADLGSGWGRIVFQPVKRGRQVSMDVCRSAKEDGSEGTFERIVVTQSKNPTLHHQARKSMWGDLWPFKGFNPIKALTD